MARHDQKPKDRHFTCSNCLRGRCHECVDVTRMVYTDETICRCKRVGHDGEPNRQQILDPETGTVYAPGLRVTVEGSVIMSHDYEPGDYFKPMHTDALCRICGEPVKSFLHNV